MLQKRLKISFLMILVWFLTACSGSQFYHEQIMKGQVVGIDNDELVICIGSKDGAKVGQELQVYRYVWEGALEEGESDYRVDYVGTLKIKSVVNDHFSRAINTEGNVIKNDVVEFVSN
tara:strand:+ start:9898 stop:10251 length:354 start_codon:yes stop_codon:yes gene_type:complete